VDEVAVGRGFDGTSNTRSATGLASRIKGCSSIPRRVDAYSDRRGVAALLEANPAERRLIFEEAAGISSTRSEEGSASSKSIRTASRERHRRGSRKRHA
jgi:hypothetical protein